MPKAKADISSHLIRCLPALNDFDITQVLLAEPLGSLAFKMVQVRQLRSEREVKLESAAHVLINICGGLRAIEYKMSGRGRGRRSIPVEETNTDNNASITQLLRLLVEQNNRGNGQFSSSRGPSNDDPQEKFRQQKPKEFSGPTDPLVAESWIKSMELPPRSGRGRTTRRTAEESRAGSDDDVHEVENVTRQIGDMELVLARFQRTNPPTFAATEGGASAEAWLAQMEELFDTLEYAPEKRLKLAVLQLRDNAQRWWRATRAMFDWFFIGVGEISP
ncbi:hypothetical protein F511_40225 [Dorcoceras hygrometricum]|uniref:Uncharacterized protein n=1 Tax=Dorcoceras hygrometricum TaxID=472368 RepID=A0A2Z7BBT2_9LAMI|nr:hypothetical protein F511_40225 [Dorcoceras hygrometricum]